MVLPCWLHRSWVALKAGNGVKGTIGKLVREDEDQSPTGVEEGNQIRTPYLPSCVKTELLSLFLRGRFILASLLRKCPVIIEFLPWS